MQVAGAVSTVSTSIDMLSEAGSNAENMAHAYRIPIPDIKKLPQSLRSTAPGS